MEKQKSPFEYRKEARTDIVNIKHEIESLEQKYKLFFNEWLEENKQAGFESTITSENWVKKEEIQADLSDLRKKLNKYFDEFKHDPTEISPSVEQHKEELEYIREKIKWVDEKLADLNSQARTEFFKNDAIKSDGTPNEEYYKIRKDIDPLIKERNKLPDDETHQSIFTREEERVATKVFESNEYKQLDSDLERFLTHKWTPRLFQEKLDHARAFLAYCKDKGERIKIEPSIEAMEKVDKLMGDALYAIDNVYVELAKQGIMVKPEDIKPYLEKIKQEEKE